MQVAGFCFYRSLLFHLVLGVDDVLVLLLLAARATSGTRAAIGGSFRTRLRTARAGLCTSRLVDLLAELEARRLERFHRLFDAVAIVGLQCISQRIQRRFDVASNVAADL